MLNYFDAAELSWDAEDHAIRSTADALADLGANVELRNEARVHLWYEARFGMPCPAYRDTRHAISTFPNCSSCLGCATRRRLPGGIRALRVH
ncbi:nucleotidyltransferase family protein [uncultured Jatrophihabitans sp.]|uniref:nucleotidyltransferase family protein n=1 Tax=uncultured Jatrophihabitans sp. TaxID=1610747 RepID=UPI0035CB8232